MKKRFRIWTLFITNESGATPWYSSKQGGRRRQGWQGYSPTNILAGDCSNSDVITIMTSSLLHRAPPKDFCRRPPCYATPSTGRGQKQLLWPFLIRLLPPTSPFFTKVIQLFLLLCASCTKRLIPNGHLQFLSIQRTFRPKDFCQMYIYQSQKITI